MRINLFMPALVVLLLAASGSEEDAVKKEASKLQGTWKSEIINLDDEKRWTELKITDKELSWQRSSLKVGSPGMTGVVPYRYRLKPDRRPKEIDLTWTQFSNKGKVQLGIYELTADTLKICVARSATSGPRNSNHS